MKQEILEKIHHAGNVFTSGAPISQKDMFAGRKSQLERVLTAITSPGRHPIIYGQRGVGKTSLANILGVYLRNVEVAKTQCDGSDTFSTIWHRTLQTTSVNFRQQAFGFSRQEPLEKINLVSYLGLSQKDMTPALVGEALRKVQTRTMFIFDEYDKLSDRTCKSYMADLIKIVSDNFPNVTILLVGVAASIAELVGAHPSVERNLVQIELPKMNEDEIKDICRPRFQKLGITVPDVILDAIVELADGFPHYAHLLGLSSATACFRNGITTLDSAVFQIGCNLAIEDAIEKYRDAYSRATATVKRSRYPKILCACSYAKCDERGVFRATDVVDAMRTVFNESMTVPSVVPGLGEFCSPKRGEVLTKVQVGKRSQYRFSDPMMRPFLRLKTKSLLFE